MITINFYRFVPTPETVKLKKDHRVHNVFKVMFDHEVHNVDAQLSLDRAKSIVKRWLQDHYGCCTIHHDNVDEFDKGWTIKVCNHRKFVKWMTEHNFEVTVRGFKNVI